MTDDITTGELSRQLSGLTSDFSAYRKEQVEATLRLTSLVQSALGPVSKVEVRIERAERDINELGQKTDARFEDVDDKINTVTTRAAQVSGGIGVLAFVGSMLPWLWKR